MPQSTKATSGSTKPKPKPSAHGKGINHKVQSSRSDKDPIRWGYVSIHSKDFPVKDGAAIQNKVFKPHLEDHPCLVNIARKRGVMLDDRNQPRYLDHSLQWTKQTHDPKSKDPPKNLNPTLEANLTKIFKQAHGKQAELIFVILPPKSSKGLYTAIKKVSEATVGIQTVCMSYEALADSNTNLDAYFYSISMKINQRFGGINYLPSDAEAILLLTPHKRNASVSVRLKDISSKTMFVGLSHATNPPTPLSEQQREARKARKSQKSTDKMLKKQEENGGVPPPKKALTPEEAAKLKEAQDNNAAFAAAPKPPTMAGLVASVDGSVNQWPGVAFEVDARARELDAETLKRNFESRLDLWLTNAKKPEAQTTTARTTPKKGSSVLALPENIVIFRGGVQDAHGIVDTSKNTVLQKEIVHIRQACEARYKAVCQPLPKITFVAAVDRHPTTAKQDSAYVAAQEAFAKEKREAEKKARDAADLAARSVHVEGLAEAVGNIKLSTATVSATGSKSKATRNFSQTSDTMTSTVTGTPARKTSGTVTLSGAGKAPGQSPGNKTSTAGTTDKSQAADPVPWVNEGDVDHIPPGDFSLRIFKSVTGSKLIPCSLVSSDWSPHGGMTY